MRERDRGRVQRRIGCKEGEGKNKMGGLHAENKMMRYWVEEWA